MKTLLRTSLIIGTLLLFFLPTPAEAALSYVGSATATGNSANYNVDLTSVSMQQGDIVIVVTGFASTTDQDPGVSTAGYTEMADLYSNGTTQDANFSVNYKIMGASPDLSVTCNGSFSTTFGSVCIAYVWRGENQTTPFDVASTTATGTGANAPDCPSITPVTPGAVVICTGLTATPATDATVTAPAGYTNQVDIGVDPGTAAIVGIASKDWNSGAEDPAVWTTWTVGSAGSYAALTLALRPDTTNYVAYNGSAKSFCDNGGGGTACTSGTTLTYSLTVGNNANRQLAVFAFVGCNSGETSPTVSSVTYAGVALNQTVATSTGSNASRGYLYTLPARIQPTVGTNNVVVTLSSSLVTCGGLTDSLTSGAISAYNVDQTNPYASTPLVNSWNGTIGTSATLTGFTSGANDLGIESVCAGSTLTSTTETARWTTQGVTTSSCGENAGATAAGGDTSYSYTVSSSDSWILIGGAFKFGVTVTTRTMRLFEGFRIKLLNGRIILYQHN